MYEVLNGTAAQTALAIESGDSIRRVAQHLHTPYETVRQAIELPAINDVATNLENYLETKERAEEIEAKIEQTDTLIDEIVYKLYGLTDKEIEIIEEVVNDD